MQHLPSLFDFNHKGNDTSANTRKKYLQLVQFTAQKHQIRGNLLIKLFKKFLEVKLGYYQVVDASCAAMEDKYFNSLSRMMSSFEVEKISHAAVWLLLLHWHLAKNNKYAPVENQKKK